MEQRRIWKGVFGSCNSSNRHTTNSQHTPAYLSEIPSTRVSCRRALDYRMKGVEWYRRILMASPTYLPTLISHVPALSPALWTEPALFCVTSKSNQNQLSSLLNLLSTQSVSRQFARGKPKQLSKLVNVLVNVWPSLTNLLRSVDATKATTRRWNARTSRWKL